MDRRTVRNFHALHGFVQPPSYEEWIINKVYECAVVVESLLSFESISAKALPTYLPKNKIIVEINLYSTLYF